MLLLSLACLTAPEPTTSTPGDSLPCDEATWYADADDDGYGDLDSTTEACRLEAPEGFVADATDCDDESASSYPGAEETCEGLDNDCDGDIDEGVQITVYPDLDKDGFGDDSAGEESCVAGDGWTETGGDCNDDNDAVNPEAAEICDDADDDCDDQIDEGIPTSLWYVDDDEDGYGTGAGIEDCVQPDGTADNADDCDDGYQSITECDSVYDVQNGTLGAGEEVVLHGLIVTGISQYGYFVQDPAGGAYSAVYVYGGSGAGDDLNRGDELAIGGETLEYNGLTEVDNRDGWVEVLSTGNDEPDVEWVTVEDYEADPEPWESVLIGFEDLCIDDDDLGYGEWSLGGVRVDDLLYDETSENGDFSTEGCYESVAAPLYYSFGNYKLVPRDGDDLVGYTN